MPTNENNLVKLENPTDLDAVKSATESVDDKEVGAYMEQQLQDLEHEKVVHAIRLAFFPKVIKWLVWVFMPLFTLAIVVIGVDVDYHDGDWSFKYKMPDGIWFLFSTIVLAVATVTGFVFRWIFQVKNQRNEQANTKGTGGD